MKTLYARWAILWVLLSLVSVCGAGAAEAAGGDSIVTKFPLGASPYQVAVEAPDRIWATLPSQNAIVRLTLTSPGYVVDTYSLPQANSEPYDIAFASGKVWVTERSGNRIGCFDPYAVTPTWTEYSIPTADSEPTGITVLAGTPVEVWFTEFAGNKLGRLQVWNDGSYVIDEYALPQPEPPEPVTEYGLESVAARPGEPIWFTAPGRPDLPVPRVPRVGRFTLSLWPGPPDPFAFLPTKSPFDPCLSPLPWDIKVESDGLPWITERACHRLGKYIPGTLTYFAWYQLPANSMPNGLDIAQGAVWVAEESGNRVGQLLLPTGPLRQYSLAGAAPTGISLDATGCAWVAASGENTLVSWCPPYFQFGFLPLTSKNR